MGVFEPAFIADHLVKCGVEIGHAGILWEVYKSSYAPSDRHPGDDFQNQLLQLILTP